VGWDAVLFDCDGVLVDSEPISCRILSQMLREAGLSYGYEQTVERFVGRSMRSCLELIEEEIGRPPPASFSSEFQQRTFAAFRSSLKPVQGVEEALDRTTWPTGVASSGDHEKLRTTLSVTGLLERFRGRVFSATDVRRGKPHPDLFLHAAEQLGARPCRCAVVEDSVLGVQAAVAAGMTAFGYTGTVGEERLRSAGAIVFDTMAVLPELLREFAPR
jgi:HAD superfamily hydrolase (TIGR01509 family)